MAVDYFAIFVIGLPILYTLHLQTHVFNAYKDAKTSTWVLGLTVAINMFLDPFLIHGLVWCWTICTYGVFLVGRLKLPHYLILLIVPAVCYIAAELNYWIARPVKQRWRQMVAIGLTVAVVASGLWSGTVRYVVNRDNAVKAAITWMNQQVPLDRLVLTDEFIGQWIKQPYCRIRHATRCVQAGDTPDYVITYATRTQKPPTDPALTSLIANSTIVASFEGYKEVVIIYRHL
jgi:hypothetical protein